MKGVCAMARVWTAIAAAAAGMAVISGAIAAVMRVRDSGIYYE